ncbi:hypothetical protein [Streptomyces sp. NPDC088246]|uniref:hypothetical protein n=1 Tax=Streptomyces sp. NPDC088246 TaxID=3365842 RepID=UPI00382C67CB
MPGSLEAGTDSTGRAQRPGLHWYNQPLALGSLRHRAALAETPGTTDLAVESVIATAWGVAGLR